MAEADQRATQDTPAQDIEKLIFTNTISCCIYNYVIDFCALSAEIAGLGPFGLGNGEIPVIAHVVRGKLIALSGPD